MAVRVCVGRQRRAPLEPPRPPRLSPRQLRGRQTPLLLQQRAPRRALPALRHSLCRSHRTRWPQSSSAPPRALVPLATSTSPGRLDRKNRLLHAVGSPINCLQGCVRVGLRVPPLGPVTSP
jgi:hypothetical protein